MCEILTLISPLELFLFKIVSGQLMPETTIFHTQHIRISYDMNLAILCTRVGILNYVCIDALMIEVPFPEASNILF